jgi:hypothetical protein
MTHYNGTQSNVGMNNIQSIIFADYDANVKWSKRTQYVKHVQTPPPSRLQEIKYTNEFYSYNNQNRMSMKPTKASLWAVG